LAVDICAGIRLFPPYSKHTVNRTTQRQRKFTFKLALSCCLYHKSAKRTRCLAPKKLKEKRERERTGKEKGMWLWLEI